jgi:hypothetical protein
VNRRETRPLDDTRPLMRASHQQSNLDALAALGEELEKKALAHISEDTLRTVREAPRNAWLPVEHDIDITEAVYRELGTEGVRGWSRDALLRSMEGPLLKPFLDGAVAVFGLKPTQMYRVVPRGFPSVYRACGDLTYLGDGDGRVTLHWERVPPVLMAHRPYVEGIAGAFEAVLEVCKVTGRVEVVAAGESEIDFVATWDAS